jgi:hypothetical protein
MPRDGIFRDIVGKLTARASLVTSAVAVPSRRVVQDSVDGVATDGAGDGALGGMY